MQSDRYSLITSACLMSTVMSMNGSNLQPVVLDHPS